MTSVLPIMLLGKTFQQIEYFIFLFELIIITIKINALPKTNWLPLVCQLNTVCIVERVDYPRGAAIEVLSTARWGLVGIKARYLANLNEKKDKSQIYLRIWLLAGELVV